MIDYIKPIICQGYHSIEFSYYDENDIPMCTIPYITSDVAEREGWRFIQDRVKKFRFSLNDDAIWMCPDCAKRYNDEVQREIDRVIELGKHITSGNYELYMRCRKDLLRLGATSEDEQKFLGNISIDISSHI